MKSNKMNKWIKGLVIAILVVLLLGLLKFLFLDSIITFFTAHPMALGILVVPGMIIILGVLSFLGILDMEQTYETPTQPGWEDYVP